MNAQAGGESAAVAAEMATPGDLLRRERERRSLSIRQAAEDLHLDVSTIAALEANRFQALGAPVYAKGHLRKYAMLLGLSPEFIIQRYEALSDTPAVPTPVPATVIAPPPRERRSWKGPLWIVFGIVVLLIAWWVLTWWLERPKSTEVPPSASVGAPATVTQEVASTLPVEEPPLATPAKTATKPPTVAARPTVPVEGPQVRLRLEYSEPSWTEIYDAAGNRLMYDMGTPERVRTIAGVAPLKVTVGFASAVTAQVNDRQVVIPRRAGKDAARFAVGADGSISE